MIARLAALALFPSLTACAPLIQRHLPPCWVNKSYKDGERVSGRVTILISDDAEWVVDGPSIMVSPLTCEHGSFGVLNPPPDLMKLRKAYHDKRPLFGSVYEGDIKGIVRLVQPGSHLSPGNPF